MIRAQIVVDKFSAILIRDMVYRKILPERLKTENLPFNDFKLQRSF